MSKEEKGTAQGDDVRFSLFCIEVAQAGIALNFQELKTVYEAARKLEDFSEESFTTAGQSVQDYINQAKKSVASVSKYKQMVDSITFNTIVRQTVDELGSRDDLIEFVGKAKRLAAVMAEELLEPDEKLEKVAEDGRRVINHFIEQWKKLPPKEEKKEYKQEETVEAISEDENL